MKKEDKIIGGLWGSSPVCELKCAYPEAKELEKKDTKYVEGEDGQMKFNEQLLKYVNEGYDINRIRQKLCSLGYTEKFTPMGVTPFLIRPNNYFYPRPNPFSLCDDFNGDVIAKIPINTNKQKEKGQVMFAKGLRVEDAHFMGKPISIIEYDKIGNERVALAQDIATVLGLEPGDIYRVAKYSKSDFSDTSLIDIKGKLLQEKGLCELLGLDYEAVSIYNAYAHIYVFSKEGYDTLIDILSRRKDLDISKVAERFREAYFVNTDNEYFVESINPVNEDKDNTIEEDSYMFTATTKDKELEELKEYIIKYEASYMLPRKYITEDIMRFVTKHIVRKPGIATRRDVVYRNYLAVSPKREVNVPLSMFEDVMYELGFKTGADYWKAVYIDK